VNVFTYWFRETEPLSQWAFVVYGGVRFLAITAPSDRLPD
jgi:hypothetical protein